MRTLFVLFAAAAAVSADSPGRIQAKFSAADFDLTADPAATQWREIKPEIASTDRQGKPVAGHRTEIRTRWTKDNLYILYSCPYRELSLKPNPSTTEETNKLWDYDVAEVFIGSDFKNIHLYKEFQVSPQGEWVDLDIDRKDKKSEGWRWNSGFKVKARVDEGRKIWYGEMRIPLKSLDTRPAEAGNEMRINFYRIQGPEPKTHVNWQPVHNQTFHTPEAFGRIVLVK